MRTELPEPPAKQLLRFIGLALIAVVALLLLPWAIICRLYNRRKISRLKRE
jgi:hypothetical protein